MVAECPGEGEWQALLHGGVSDADQARLARHLEACQLCRTRFDELAGGLDWLQGAAGQLDPAHSDSSHLRRGIEADNPPPMPEWHHRAERRPQDVDLGFLG